MTYASWRKCDFQVHTPRDPNWSGQRLIGIGDGLDANGTVARAEDVDPVRMQWAHQFIDQCVLKGLNAIALTDHNEMVMVPYVQQAISERSAEDKDFDLWLFPGMELTASGGRQCLILFDADLSDEWRKQAQGRLGIVHADLNEKSAQSPKVAQLKCSYPDIGPLLDEVEQLKGRYIILPNVSQGNGHTVLIDKAHDDFRRMPYLGGYLDAGQTIKTLSSKNKTRLSGADKAWSIREIYPLPTSDSRTADFASLGTNDTWIKLAEPTAEAIRQAFLGHQSRIRIEPPRTAALTVGAVQVIGSTIIQPTNLALSPELNSVIGGRGSGKSSLLEYIAFGLGRSCYDLEKGDYSNKDRMKDLLNDTIVSKGGRVVVTLLQDNAVFEILRGPETSHQPQIKYPNGTVQTVSTKDLRELFPAVVYSQGELAEIGKQSSSKTRLADLLQFVDADFKRQDNQLNADIETAKSAVRKTISELVDHWQKQEQLRKLGTNRDSLRQRVTALEKTLPKLSDDDQATLTRFEKVSDFEAKRVQATRHADQMVSELSTLSTELLNERDLSSDLVGETKPIRDAYSALYGGLRKDLKALKDGTLAARQVLKTAEDSWTLQFEAARQSRDKVLEKLGAHKTATSQIIQLKEQISEITNQIGHLEALIQAASNPADRLATVLVSLKQASDKRVDQTVVWAGEIQRLSSGIIKANVEKHGDLSEVRDAIETVSAKTGSQETSRIKALDSLLERDAIWDVIDHMRTDCLSLLHWRQLGAATGEKEPACTDVLAVVGESERVKTVFLEKLDVLRVEAIATAVPKPEIALSYCDGAREISFDKASEGQRAAALLFMLLQQPGGPLIIDQPEGDLDNKIIADLTDKLHGAKQNRQLIFASHNANIVVNGSSELVAHMDTHDTGAREIACAGAIDHPDICRVITSTMEGGEKAFKDRQVKYGY